MPGIVAIMSMPRLAFTDNLFCAMCLPQMGIPIYKSCGVFWEKGMTQLFDRAIEAGADYALAIDYDTIFTAADVKELLRLATLHGAEAIFATQLKREADTILCEMQPGAVLLGDVTPCKAGHFGLTLIKLAALAKVPKPWLWGRPSPENCEWDGPGHQDADMTFWSLVNHEGWKILQANHVRVGHLQRVVSWPMPDGTVRHQYLSDYEKTGRPETLPAAITSAA